MELTESSQTRPRNTPVMVSGATIAVDWVERQLPEWLTLLKYQIMKLHYSDVSHYYGNRVCRSTTTVYW